MIATANAQAVVSSSSTGAQARIISTCEGPTNQQCKEGAGWGTHCGHIGDTLLDFTTTNELILILILIDRLSHFAVFPSNEISKKLERRGARKRKERKAKEEGEE
jgi:hypothetical protein